MFARLFSVGKTAPPEPAPATRRLDEESPDDDDVEIGVGDAEDFVSVASDDDRPLPGLVTRDEAGFYQLEESDDDGTPTAQENVPAKATNPRPPPLRPHEQSSVDPIAPLAVRSGCPRQGPGPVNGRGGRIRAAPSYRYGPSVAPSTLTTPRVVLRPRLPQRGRWAPPGGLRVPPTRPVEPAPVRPPPVRPSGSTLVPSTPSRSDEPLDWRKVPPLFPKKPAQPAPSTTSRTVTPTVGGCPPSSVPSTVHDLGLTFAPSNKFDYAHLIPKYVEAPTHAARYGWLWKWARRDDTATTKHWRSVLECELEALGETCYAKLQGKYAINHPVAAGLIHDDVIDTPLNGRVLLCTGVLNTPAPMTFESDDSQSWAPSAAALLSPYRDDTGDLSGLSLGEARMCLLWAHTRQRSVRAGFPSAGFEIEDDEWILTTSQQVAEAGVAARTRPLAARLGQVGEQLDEAFRDILQVADAYSVNVGALEQTLASRKRPWSSE
ncbi:hypothetical protein FOZ63_002843 [Perkinsus olseni]|uniref:Uncharacterized protein n=1 Tax=Perkinsus olseni TaxID=32597 RepID=A0A7J6PSB3_PEROL|nr:hypothetical protein FOZ62_001914 [Perkinsus olseni]KAF4754521.1 hypothetical protein FOZ63_002843 [Perkinsus olseni]